MFYHDLKIHPSISLENRRPVVFLHIPKTAGSSFNEILFRHFNYAQRCPWNFMEQPFVDFSKYDLFFGLFYKSVIQKLVANPVYLCFFRNPISRSISHYYQLLRIYQDNPLRLPNLALTIDEYVDDRQYNYMITNLQTQTLGAKLQFTTYDELQDNWAESNKQVVSGQSVKAEEVYPIVDSLDFIGITEEFTKSLQILTHTFGWEPLETPPSKNIGAYKEPKPAVIDKIIELNREDIKLYEYVVKVFNHRFNDTVQALTRHYYLMTRASATPRSKIITQHFQQSLNEGWHSPEITSSGIYYVWSATTRSPLDLAIESGEDLLLIFHVISALSADVLDSLTVYIHHHRLTLTPKSLLTGEIEYRGVIPRQAIPDDVYFSKLTFEIGRVIRPVDIDPTSSDDRNLGIALSWLNIRPMPLSPRTSTLEQLSSDAMITKLHLIPPTNPLKGGTVQLVPITVQNKSARVWPSLANEDGVYATKLGVYWLNDADEILPDHIQYFDLPEDVQPDDRVEGHFPLAIPNMSGRYTLALTVFQVITPSYARPFNSPPYLMSVEVIA